MNEPERPSNLFRELSRRRIFRSAGAYIVVAWVTIQVGDIVFPEFGAPDWAMRALMLAWVVGFPPAMLLAWTLDITSGGLERTPDSGYSRSAGAGPKVGMFIVSTVMAGGALWWLWDDYIVRPDGPSPRVEIKPRPVIVIDAPQQRVGSSENAWLGDGIANLIRSEVSASQHVIVISQARWAELSGDAETDEETLPLARRLGVDYLVDGEYFEAPDGIVLTLRVGDVENGIVIASPRAAGQSVAEILAGAEQLGIEIKRALMIPHQERVGQLEADFVVDNLVAYEAFIAGLAYLVDFDYDSAERALTSALTEAPEFHVARLRLAQLYDATGQSTLAVETLHEIPEETNLSPRMQLYVEGAGAYFAAERDEKKAIEVFTRLVELYPYEMEAGLLLAEAYWNDFQDDKAIAELQRLTEIHGYDPSSWMALGERLLDTGQLAEAGQALGRYIEMRPEDAFAHALLANLAILEGRYADAIGDHQAALRLRPGFVVARLGLARANYMAGNVAAALDAWRSVVADDSVAADYRIDAVFDLAGVYRGLGRFRESIAAFDSITSLIQQEGLRWPMALTESAAAHMALGEFETAGVLIDEALEQVPTSRPTRYLFVEGQLEIELGRLDRAIEVAERIRSSAENAESLEDVETRAADYLAGRAALAGGELAIAGEFLTAASESGAYAYALYDLALARLHRKLGDLDAAAGLAKNVYLDREADDLRLDLELDRARAQLLHAEILAEQGAVQPADEQARRFIERWQNADAGLPELDRARTLLVD